MSTYVSGQPQIGTKFGRMVSASQIEANAIIVLKKWFPTYLNEQERQLGMRLNTFPNPTNYTVRNSFDTLEGEPLPKVVAISPGMIGTPLKYGRGQYRGLWSLDIGVAISAKDEETSNRATKAFGSAVRGIIVQKMIYECRAMTPSLPVCNVTWIGERYDDLPIPNQIMLFKGATVNFQIDIEDIVNSWGGPPIPIQPTGDPNWGQVETVDIEIDEIEIDETP